MADVWANSMACHPTATYHIIGWCHLVNIHCHDSRATCHIAGCSHLAKSMSRSCHIAECKNSTRHIENLKIVLRHIYLFLFLMQFRLWRAAAFESSPIHLLWNGNIWNIYLPFISCCTPFFWYCSICTFVLLHCIVARNVFLFFLFCVYMFVITLL